ncbi:MAG: TonB-dependent receptor [Chakrabartia sp.]
MTFFSSPFRLAASSLLALTAPHIALAADVDAAPLAPLAPEAEAETLDTIVVTARHRDERLQDVPLAISAVAGAELNAKHLDRVGDYATRVPNFAALQQNTRVSGLFIRGLGGNASNDGAEGGVGLIVDNVFFTHVGFSWLDFVDLESVEVARGPQGTLLGKNTTIGAVIVRTAKPSFTPGLNISATLANHGRYQARANATGPLISDKLAYRLTLAGDLGGGWITNAYDGHKFLDNRRWSARGQLLWTPTPDISSRLIAEHYESHEFNNFYPPAADVNANLRLDGSIISPRAASWTNKLVTRFNYTPSFDVPNNANYNTQERLTARTDGLSNELNWDLGGPTLTAVSAWRRLYFRPANDGDGTPFSLYRNGYDVDVDQYSQEVRLASPTGGAIDWQIGSYYLHEDLRSVLRQIFYADASKFVLGAAVPSAVLNGVEFSKDGALKVDSIAGFGQATAHLNEAFSLTAGLRYTNELKRVTVIGRSTGGADLSATPALLAARNATLANFGGTAVAAAGAYQLEGRARRGSWSWLINPALKITPDILLYGLASYGEKSGAANTAASAAQAAVALTDPEKSLDFEAGLKTSWLGGRVTANFNLYNNIIRGYQDARIDPLNPGIGSFLANVGKVRLRGFELETTAEIARGVTLHANAAHNDATYLSYDDAPAPLEYQVALGGTAATLPLTGYQIRGAPRWTVQGGASFDRPVNDHLAVTGYADVSWRSAVAFINPRSNFGRQSAYALVNAGLGIRGADKDWSLLFWAKNLFDKRYAAAFGAATALTPVIEILGDPRSFGATLSKRF